MTLNIQIQNETLPKKQTESIGKFLYRRQEKTKGKKSFFVYRAIATGDE